MVLPNRLKVMGCFLGMGIFGVSAAFAAPLHSAVKSSARGVVGVVAEDAAGNVLEQISGVVITHDRVVGSCHVLTAPNTRRLAVVYRHQSYLATVRKMDLPDDTCMFVAAALPAPALAVDGKIKAKAGQPVYVVGATATGVPVIGAGQLTALPAIEGTVMRTVKVSAPTTTFGGGLFDTQGHLIGVIVSGVGAGGNTVQAFPVTEIRNLVLTGTAPVRSNGKRLVLSQAYLTAVDAANREDYAAAVGPMTSLAKQGDMHAQFFLHAMYMYGLGVPTDKPKAVRWLHKSAQEGDLAAQAILGMAYMTGQDGLSKDDAKAVELLSKAAQGSVVIAQAALGSLYLRGHGVPQDVTKGLALSRQAADQGSGLAQVMLGGAYAAGLGVKSDKVQALKWILLAKAGGAKHVSILLIKLKLFMSSVKEAKAKQLAKLWTLQHRL